MSSKRPSKSSRAGLVFPVNLVQSKLKKGGYAARVGDEAGVYLTAVLEQVVAEILEPSGDAAQANQNGRIIPRHINLAIQNDIELNKLLGRTMISEGGFVPSLGRRQIQLEQLSDMDSEPEAQDQIDLEPETQNLMDSEPETQDQMDSEPETQDQQDETS